MKDRFMKKKKIAYTELIEAIEKLQDIINDENELRALESKDESWNLVQNIEIKPQSVIITTEEYVMEFDKGVRDLAKIRKRNKKSPLQRWLTQFKQENGEMLDNETLQNYYDNYIQKQRRHPSQSGWTVSPFNQEDIERMRDNIEEIKRQLFETFYEEEEE
tara:strand:- start:329 stop:811 length:483 start_codon:yes stop_codon:yes gene_type:complete